MNLPRDEEGRFLPHLVQGVETCFGVPRHMTMCVDFITWALHKIGMRHDRLPVLVADVFEGDPVASLRLL